MTRSLRICCRVACVLFVMQTAVPAQESIRVKASIKPENVYVGQKTTITVEVLTTTFFVQQPEIRIAKIATLAMLSDPISKGPISEELGDDSYSGVSFEFVAFPLRYGDLDIPPFQITTFQRQDDGKILESHPVMTPLKLHVTLPEAAIDLTSLICTSEFTIEDRWDPPLKDDKTARVGDAFTRTVTMRAPDLLGMILPPLPDLDQSGLRAYAKPPVVKDEMNRGDLAATRIEEITFQCEKPGYYELPRIEIPWWDVKNGELKRAVLQPVNFDVAPNPDEPPVTADSKPQGESQNIWIAIGFATGLIAFSIWFFRKKISLFDDRSEIRLFLAVERACKNSSAKETYAALVKWVKVVRPDATSLLDLFSSGDRRLRDAIVTLERVVVGIESDWPGDDLLNGLRAWRHYQHQASHVDSLPSLNPLESSVETTVR